MNDGEKKFKEMGEKLKNDTREAVETEKKETAIALSNLDAIRKNAELAKMYSESAQVGAENLSGELPLLKVHAVGKSTKNELSDGTEPKDGWFFYKPTGEQFETVRCHILTISRGFRAEGMEKKEIFNQVMGGVIIDNGEMKPFVMYMTGLKLSPMWEFGKSVSKYTKMKPVPIPMFALTVNLTTEKVANAYGKSWIVRFELEKNEEDGSPVLVMDQGEFQFLKDSTEMVEETITSLIEAKAIAEDGTVKHTETAQVVAQPAKVVEGDDIPF